MSSSNNRDRDISETKESSYIGKHSIKDLYNSYITIDDLKKHPEITPALKGDKKMKLDILSKVKPKIINIKGLQNESKIKFATRLNSFHKIFFDYYKNQNNSLGPISTLRKENREFMKKFKNANKNEDKEKFKDIKAEYEKRKYFIPSIDRKKNLFNGNILLSNKEELKNYILYDLGSNLSNSRSLCFLHKINKKLGDKTSEKALKLLNGRLNMDSDSRDKIGNDPVREIKREQNDIMSVRDTINSMDEIDSFFEIDNKQYIKELKNQDSRENSEIKVNKTINFQDSKYQNNIRPSNNSIDTEVNQRTSINLILNDNYRNKKKGTNISRLSKLSNDGSENKYLSPKNNNRYEMHNAKTIENERNKSPLEKLYDRISTKDNLLNYQTEIDDYLKNKKLDISVRINPSIICNNFEKTKEKICQTDSLKQDIHLRKQVGGDVASSVDKISNNDIKAMKRVNNIEEKIVKLFCDINIPRKKSE